jgi:hypothetical protein
MNRIRHRTITRLVIVCLLGLPAWAGGQTSGAAQYFKLGTNGPVPGRAPGLAVDSLGRVARVTELRMTAGDEVMSGLLDYAREHKPKSGVLVGIGGFRSAVFAWYDPAKKAFKRIPVDQKGEVVSFTGTVSYKDGKANVHVHAIMSLSDGTTRGGHLVSAEVAPIMQVYVLETSG